MALVVARRVHAKQWIAACLALLAVASILATPSQAQSSAGPDTDRLAGRSRVDTAIELSRYQFPGGAREVYLSRSDVLADAVAAGSLTDGPVLLTPACGTLPAAVADEIERLAPDRVVALGGPSAVCGDILAQAGRGRAIRRIAGNSRIGTAVELARFQFPQGAEEVYLARSDVLADAVAAGSLTRGPVLLTPACGTLPADVAGEIQRLDPDRVVALGGPSAVCADMLSQAGEGRYRSRIAGSTRVGTAVELSTRAFPEGAGEVYLARGDVLADAVAAGSLTRGPILLAPACGTLPAGVAGEIQRLDPDRVVALGGPSAVCAGMLSQARGHPVDACPAPVVTELGAATTASPVVTATFHDGRNYVVTRGLTPPVVGAFDPATETIDRQATLPAGQGAWASTVDAAGMLYVGTYQPAHLYRVDPTTMAVTKVAEFPGATYIHGLATAPDGEILVGTLPDGGVWSHNPGTGSTRPYGAAVPGEYAVRSIAGTADTIYAGVGSHAHLMAIDRVTGERSDILPPELADQSFVYTLAASEEFLVAGTEPDGRVAVLPLANPAAYRLLPRLGERTVDAITIDGDDVYFTGRTSGSVYHYDITRDVLRELATPAHREETRGLFLVDDVLVGTGGTGIVWRHDLRSGATDLTHLSTAGLPGGSEPVQSLLGLGGSALVGGHWGMQLHTDDGRPPARLRIPGEPKALAQVGDAVFSALYPSGELWRTDTVTGSSTRVATIGHEQARPRDLHFDARTGRLLIASQSDYGVQGGALSVYDTATGNLAVHRDIVEQQSVASVTAAGDTVYVGTELRGGIGADPVAGSAGLAAWDPAAGARLWSITPVPGATSVVDVATLHGTVYGLTADGVMFAVNPRSREVIATATVGRGRGLVVQDDSLYATTARGLLRVDPDSLAHDTVVGGSGLAHLAEAGACGLYVARGRDLLAVNR